MYHDSPAVRSVDGQRYPVAVLVLGNLDAGRANFFACHNHDGLDVLAIGSVDPNIGVIGVYGDLGSPRQAVVPSPLFGAGEKRQNQEGCKYAGSSFWHTPPPLHWTRVLRKRKPESS